MKDAAHKKVTLTLPEPLLREFRDYAASRNKPMSQFMAEAMSMLLEKEGERLAANRRILARMQNAPDLGMGGVITWTRDERYKR